MKLPRRIRSKNKKDERLPVDKSKLNLGKNSDNSPPEYYYDVEFRCSDCKALSIWTAAQQKWWYEEVGASFYSQARRCRECREQERARKQEARRRSGHG